MKTIRHTRRRFLRTPRCSTRRGSRVAARSLRGTPHSSCSTGAKKSRQEAEDVPSPAHHGTRTRSRRSAEDPRSLGIASEYARDDPRGFARRKRAASEYADSEGPARRAHAAAREARGKAMCASTRYTVDDARRLIERRYPGGWTRARPRHQRDPSRRRCTKCDKRFTTYERVELRMPRMVKKGGAAPTSTRQVVAE